MKKPVNRVPACIAALPRWLFACTLVGLGGCSADRRDEPAAAHSGVPGHVTAGGATSGEIIARSKGSEAQGSDGPQGTPGIPQGSGGTTGGPNMGGVTGAQAASDNPPRSNSESRPGTSSAEPGSGKPGGHARIEDDPKQDRPDAPADKEAARKESASKEAAAKAAAERQQQQLVAAMDRVVARWQERQASRSGSATEAVDASRAAPAQQPPRSEKHGGAPASEDVKKPQVQSPQPSGASLPSDAYKHGQ